MKEFLKNNWQYILLLILCAALIVSLIVCHELHITAQNQSNNLRAIRDTLHTYELKNGELLYEKQGYILKIGELEENIGITKKEAREIEKKLKSALATISKLEGQLKMDTTVMHDSVYVTPDSVYHNNFYYADDWVNINGTSTFQFKPFDVSTQINGLTMRVPLKVGSTKDNQFFVVSENPYVTFTSIESANLEKAKPKRFSVGIQGGLGALLGWGISGGKDGIVRSGWIFGGGFYLGIGITYKFLEF